MKTLRVAKVIDEKNNWIAGKTHLVQTGDVLDRAPDSKKAVDLLMKLEKQADKVGGKVHALIGNHEAMVMLGQWHYVHPGEIESFGGEKKFRETMSPTGKYGKWISGHNAIIKINDILFLHGGLSGQFAKKTLNEINDAIREGLKKKDGMGILNHPSGPLWDRSLALGGENEVARQLEKTLKHYGANRVVVGHTASTEGVFARASNRVIRIDVGMSSYYGGPAECLVVEKGVYYRVRHPKMKKRLPIKPVPAEKKKTEDEEDAKDKKTLDPAA